MKPPRTTRSREIMAIVREMSATGASQQEIAQQARTSRGHVTHAVRLLGEAPDLAAGVERGQITLVNAYRILTARKLGAPAASTDLQGRQDTHRDVQGRPGPVRDRTAAST
jgi:hypothetical protein